MYEKNYIKSINHSLKSSLYFHNEEPVQIEYFFEEIRECLRNVQKDSGRLFFIGNGASAAFSNHMALDWAKNGGIVAHSLSDSALLTALANDYSYNEAFVEYLKIYKISSNDVVITTSSSGNSENIVNVLSWCSDNNIKTITLSGLNEMNKSIILSNYSLFVPAKTYGIVECVHQVFHHLILDKFMNIKEWDRVESQNMDASNFKL